MPFAGGLAALALFLTGGAMGPSPQVSNTTASLRGLSVVSSRVAWASGTHGTYLITTDGGAHWQPGAVPEAESLDFRDVEAFDAQTAYLLSSGTGAASRLYQTVDGGRTWKLRFTNPDAIGFLDALAFWDRKHGIILGDPVNGHFAIFTTSDGGQTWTKQGTPPALPEEGAFAASGTCLVVHSKQSAWFATGGPGAARVFQSNDRGQSWTVAATPLSGTTKSSGIFSLVFTSAKDGLAVGGDYQKPQDTQRTVAVTRNGGRTWKILTGGQLSGYRSGAAARGDAMLAVGTSGADFSSDGGQTWTPMAAPALHAVAAIGKAWLAVGPRGTIVKFGRQ